MKLFKSLFHVTLFVNDIKKTIDFYEKLGFEVIFGISEKEGDEPWNYYMKIANGQYLELQPVNAPNPFPHPEKATYYKNQTAWHYALETDDMDLMISTLLERGIPLYFGPDPRSGEVKAPGDVFMAQDGCRVCWTIDPDGTPIELMEQTGETLQKKNDPESYK